MEFWTTEILQKCSKVVLKIPSSKNCCKLYKQQRQQVNMVHGSVNWVSANGSASSTNICLNTSKCGCVYLFLIWSAFLKKTRGMAIKISWRKKNWCYFIRQLLDWVKWGCRERNEVGCSFDIDANLEFSYSSYSNFVSMDSVSLSDIKTFIEHLHFKVCAWDGFYHLILM